MGGGGGRFLRIARCSNLHAMTHSVNVIVEAKQVSYEARKRKTYAQKEDDWFLPFKSKSF